MDISTLKEFIGKNITIETIDGKKFIGELKRVDDIGLLVNENVPAGETDKGYYLIYNNIISISIL